MMALEDLWPTEVGYNTLSDYRCKRYDAQVDPFKKVQHLILSWKDTALRHKFSSPAIQALSCEVHGELHKLIFAEENSIEAECKSLLCRVQKLEVEIDVDEDPEDTCVRLTLNGINALTEEEFTLSISVYRSPIVKTFTNFSLSSLHG